MSSWRIDIPHGAREQPLDAWAISGLPRALPNPEDRDIARQVMLDAMLAGTRTIGDLLDQIESASPAERRRILDKARVARGLPDTAAVDADRSFKATQAALPRLPQRDEAGRTIALCAAESCRAFPVDPTTGAPQPTKARRWWCDEHRDLAAEGDLDDWNPRISYGPSGSIVFLDELEVERSQARVEEESRERRRAEHQVEVQAELERAQAHEDAFLEHLRPKSPAFDPLP